MKRVLPGRSVCSGVTVATAGLVAAVVLAGAGVPHIDIIEPFLTNQVLIHFNTDANRAYTVQRCTSFVPSSNGVTAVWSNIVHVPAQPFNDHFVAVDTNKTLPVRFYRLMVTPQ